MVLPPGEHRTELSRPERHRRQVRDQRRTALGNSSGCAPGFPRNDHRATLTSPARHRRANTHIFRFSQPQKKKKKEEKKTPQPLNFCGGSVSNCVAERVFDAVPFLFAARVFPCKLAIIFCLRYPLYSLTCRSFFFLSAHVQKCCFVRSLPLGPFTNRGFLWRGNTQMGRDRTEKIPKQEKQ